MTGNTSGGNVTGAGEGIPIANVTGESINGESEEVMNSEDK
jgi:hypothetical protein